MDKVGIYVHVPFCKSRCKYCNFYTLTGCDELIVPYFNALKLEIANYPRLEVDTIYFGGGTPTYAGVTRVSELLEFIRERHTVSEDCEITVECNPGTVDTLGFTALLEAGVNRVSIGVQSANNCELNMLGREHTFLEAQDCVKAARSAGLSNISVDLMFGLPLQGLHNFETTLKTVAALDVTHISAYELKVEEGTPFHTIAPQLPDEDIVADMYEMMVEFLEKKGFMRYEISNFAKIGYESRHNLKYWQCLDYIGIGAAAHSCFCGKRYSNVEDVGDYIAGGARCAAGEFMSEEFVFLGLRTTNGIDIDEFERRFGMTVFDKFGEKIAELKARKLLCEEGGRLFIPQKLMFVSNSIMYEFVM